MSKAEQKRQQRLAQDRARKLGVQSAAIAVITWMSAYYVIIYFHLELIRRFTSGPAAALGLWVGMFALTLSMKGGMVALSARMLGVRAEWASIALNASLYLAGLLGFGGVVLVGWGWAKQLLSSLYWASAHWLWVCTALLLLFGFLYAAMLNARLLKWQFITDLKAVPLISPVFCFAGPKLWTDNLDKTVFAGRFPIYNVLSITAGCLFLAYWIAFAIFNQRNLDASGKVISSSPNNTLGVKVCLAICGADLYLFLIILLDILTRLATP